MGEHRGRPRYVNGALEAPSVPAGNTSIPWGLLIPKLAVAYPGKDVVLHLIPAASPQFRSHESIGLSGWAGYHLNSSVVEDDGSLTYTHTLYLDVTFAARSF